MKKTRTDYVINFLIGAFLTIICLLFLYPIVHVLAASFSDPMQLMNHRGLLFKPTGFSLDGYKAVMQNKGLWTGYGNTIFYVLAGTFVNMVFTIVAAYVLSRKGWRLKKQITFFIVFTMYFAGGIIPNYILVTQWLGLRDSMWAVILPPAISTFNFLLMKSFFAGLPEELEEAASIDGMGTYGIFLKIVLPLSKAIIATMTLFYIVGMWNEWFGPFMYLDTPSKMPVALYVRSLVEGANQVDPTASSEASNVQSTLKSATMVLTTLPIVCVYPFVQKYFVQGMTMGAVKG